MASGSHGLSLRERLRLEAQQRLASREKSSPVPNGADDVGGGADGASDSDDGVPLPALTLGGRPQRQAVRNAPKTYDIALARPSDTSGHVHPRAKPSLTMPSSAAKQRLPSDDVLRLLREKNRRTARGTDQDGYSRAEAIANSMERDRLLKMGIASDDFPSTSLKDHDNVAGPSKNSLTVRALSPTIPTFMWSSQSEEEGNDQDESSSLLSSSSEVDVDPAAAAEARIAASLLATAPDSKDAQAAVDILRKDSLQQSMDKSTNRSGDGEGHGRLTFWREGRTSRPSVYEFCNAPKPGLDDAVQDSDIDVNAEWDQTAVHVLLAGAIPPSLQLSQREVHNLLQWTAFTYVLADDNETSQLSLALFYKLAAEQPSSVQPTMALLIGKIPHVLKRIGMRDDVLQRCFLDLKVVGNEVCPVVRRGKRKRMNRSRGRCKMHLTLVERDEVLIGLCRLVRAVLAHIVPKGSPAADLFPGIVASFALASACSTNLELQSEIGGCLQDLFALPLIDEARPLDNGLMLSLQKETCRRLLGVADKTLPSQYRLVSALNGAGMYLQEVRRLLAWSFLVQQQGECDDMAMPWVLDLDRLERVVNHADPVSPFYVSPPRREGAEEDHVQTDYQVLIAAVHLLAAALHDLPVHMCTYEPPSRTSTPNPTPTQHDQPPSPTTTNRTTSNPPKRVTTLTLAMIPYKAMRPALHPPRVHTLYSIVTALANVGHRIRDNTGDIVLRTLAKDLIQRTAHALEYQLALFDPASAKRSYDLT